MGFQITSKITSRISARLGAAALMGLAGLSCAMLGCSSGDTQYMNAQERFEAFQPPLDTYAKMGYRRDWTGFPTMTAGGTVEFIDVLGDVVVVEESSNVLTVLEEGSGATRWFEQVASPLTKFVGNIRDDKHLISASESEAYFFDVETGNLVDKQPLDKVVNTRPVLVNDRLVFATSLGEIFAQLKTIGFRVWGNRISGSIQTNPAVMGPLLGFVSSTGEVIILDAATGVGQMRTQIFVGSDVDPAASDSMMFVASLDHSLYAFSPTSPAPVWRKRTEAPLREKPTYHDGRVYCSIDGTGLVAFDSRGENGNAKEVWTAKGVSGTVVGMRKNRLIVWNGSEVVMLDPADGGIVDRAPLPDVAFLKTDKFVDGNLYTCSSGGVVVKLVPRN